MEELYVENFYQRAQFQPVREMAPLLEPALQPYVEAPDPLLQIKFYLSELESTLAKDFKSFHDFRFLLAKIKKALEAESTLVVYLLLNELEELMDVELNSK